MDSLYLGPRTRTVTKQRRTNRPTRNSKSFIRKKYTQTKTIQISTNLKFASIEFDTITIMETFCQEPLNIVDACQTLFRPDYIKRNIPAKRYTIISFFNVPAESDTQLLNDFLDQYADIEGQPRHQIKKYNEIECKIRTITYKVSSFVTDIPRYNQLFG